MGLLGHTTDTQKLQLKCQHRHPISNIYKVFRLQLRVAATRVPAVVVLVRKDMHKIAQKKIIIKKNIVSKQS